jgi:hypothetical protein
MRIPAFLTALTFGAALLAAAGCGTTSALRYGADGQPEYFVDCSKEPMAKCYKQALRLCPQGYFLVTESQTPGGTKAGSVFGHMSHVGAETNSTEVTWKNQLVVRCKPAPAAAGPEAATPPR